MIDVLAMNIVELLAEPFSYSFMQRAFAVTVIAAIVCGVLSSWLILIGWALMGDAISHAVLPGVVIAYMLGLPYGVGALIFALAAAGLISAIRRTAGLKQDTSIGIVFTTLFSLGIVLISIMPSQVDLLHILFGNLLGVSSFDLWQVVIMATVVLIGAIIARRQITLFAYDPEFARAIGLRPQLIATGLLFGVAATAVVALKAVGVVLVVALLITPGATALLLNRRIWHMLWIAPTIAATCAVTGTYLSYYLDTAPGGTIVVVQGVVFAGVWLWTTGRRVLRRERLEGREQDRQIVLSRDVESIHLPR